MPSVSGISLSRQSETGEWPSSPASSQAETPTAQHQKGLSVLLRRHVDKLKQRRSSCRPTRTSRESDDEEAAPRGYERLEQAVKRQLTRGRAATRKLHQLGQKLEARKRAVRFGSASAAQDDNDLLVAKRSRKGLQVEDEDDDAAVVFPRGPFYLSDDSCDDFEEDDEEEGEVIPQQQFETGDVEATAVALAASTAAAVLAAWLSHVAVTAAATAAAVAQIVALRRRLRSLIPPKSRRRKLFLDKKSTKKTPKKSNGPHWTVPMATGKSDGNSWAPTAASSFNLRGPKYLQDRCKRPSDPALYDPVAVHVFRSTGSPDVAALLETMVSREDANGPFPTFLAFNVAVPTEAPSMRGWWPGNPCWAVVIIFKLSQRTLGDAARPVEQWPATLRLLKSWLEAANEDPSLNSRLKGIFTCRAAAAAGNDDRAESTSEAPPVPRILQKWNGKPVLMAENPVGFSRHRKGISKLSAGPGYVEIAINVGESFSYMGRAAVYLMIGKLAGLDCDVGFTLEGRADDELPETVVGAITFSRLRLVEKFKHV